MQGLIGADVVLAGGGEDEGHVREDDLFAAMVCLLQVMFDGLQLCGARVFGV